MQKEIGSPGPVIKLEEEENTRSLLTKTKENFNQILQGLGLVQAAMYEC